MEQFKRLYEYSQKVEQQRQEAKKQLAQLVNNQQMNQAQQYSIKGEPTGFAGKLDFFQYNPGKNSNQTLEEIKNTYHMRGETTNFPEIKGTIEKINYLYNKYVTGAANHPYVSKNIIPVNNLNNLFKNNKQIVGDLFEYSKRIQRYELIIKLKEKIKIEAKALDIDPVMIAGVILNETPRPFKIDDAGEYDTKQKFLEMKTPKYPTVGIGQVSPISALVEIELNFPPILDNNQMEKRIEYFKINHRSLSKTILEKEITKFKYKNNLRIFNKAKFNIIYSQRSYSMQNLREKMEKILKNEDYSVKYISKILKKK